MLLIANVALQERTQKKRDKRSASASQNLLVASNGAARIPKLIESLTTTEKSIPEARSISKERLCRTSEEIKKRDEK